MSCDECKWYNWYYDYCKKWDCKIDGRAVHNCYEKSDTSVSDAMKEATDLNEVIDYGRNNISVDSHTHKKRIYVLVNFVYCIRYNRSYNCVTNNQIGFVYQLI